MLIQADAHRQAGFSPPEGHIGLSERLDTEKLCLRSGMNHRWQALMASAPEDRAAYFERFMADYEDVLCALRAAADPIETADALCHLEDVLSALQKAFAFTLQHNDLAHRMFFPLAQFVSAWGVLFLDQGLRDRPYVCAQDQTFTVVVNRPFCGRSYERREDTLGQRLWDWATEAKNLCDTLGKTSEPIVGEDSLDSWTSDLARMFEAEASATPGVLLPALIMSKQLTQVPSLIQLPGHQSSKEICLGFLTAIIEHQATQNTRERATLLQIMDGFVEGCADKRPPTRSGASAPARTP